MLAGSKIQCHSNPHTMLISVHCSNKPIGACLHCWLSQLNLIGPSFLRSAFDPACISALAQPSIYMGLPLFHAAADHSSARLVQVVRKLPGSKGVILCPSFWGCLKRLGF